MSRTSCVVSRVRQSRSPERPARCFDFGFQPQGVTTMTHKGFSHIGLSTLDLDKTRAFYEGVLGFKPVVVDTITIKDGGHLRHLFFDVAGGQLIGFLEP